MSWLRADVLLDEPLVHVRDVTCKAPRSKCGSVECAGVTAIILPRRGVFEVHRRNDVAVADANTGLIFTAGEEFRVTHPTAGGDACTALTFAPEVAEEGLDGLRVWHGTLRAATQLAVRRVTARLRQGAFGLEGEEAGLLLLGAVTTDLGRAGRSDRLRSTSRARIERARSLLACEPTASWSVDRLARTVHCSPFHLARQFRLVTGETIAGYLLRLRLGVALERIAAGENDLGRLARELGFAHHSHFTARFRATYATTPSQVRRILTAPLSSHP